MRRILFLAAVAAVLVAPQSVAAATKKVSITRTKFSPVTVTVLTGDKVSWKNKDSIAHQVVSNSGAFASPMLGAGKSWTRTFAKVGTFKYHDGLHPALKAKVVVKARPVAPAVSITTPQTIVTYGTFTTITGTTSMRKANETVAIFAKRFDQGSYVQVATVLTGANGTFSYNVAPGLQTVYQARFKGALSSELTVFVRPRVRLLGARKYLAIRVLGESSFAGRYAILQRRTASGSWAGVKRYQLGRRSGKFFRIPRRHGVSVYRAYLSARQAGPGYLESWSGMQRVVRR